MQPDRYLRVVRIESGALAAAAARGLTRPVPRYHDWTVRDLVVHTSRIHRWVTEIVRSRATDRIPQPDIAPPDAADALLDWFIGGSEVLAATLADTDPATPVWTFAGEATALFWRRRMALETTIHRWDAQQAVGTPAPIGPDLAHEGVDEALRVYLEPRLAGQALGGVGQRVRLRCADSGRTWTVRIDDDAFAVTDDDPSADAVDAVIEAPAADLWLLLMGRLGLHAARVDGDEAAAQLCQRVAGLVPSPRR